MGGGSSSVIAATVIVTLAVAIFASVFMAWAIGAGSSGSTPFAPAVGANAISVMRAAFLVGLLGLAGAALQGANVSEAIGRQLVQHTTLNGLAAAIALLTAASLVSVGVFTGYPIATAFTVTGSVVGVGLALGGDPAWAKYQQIVALWILVPFVGGGVAYGVAQTLDSEHISPEVVVPVLGIVVGLIFSNIEFVLLAPGSRQASIAEWATRITGGPAPLISVTVMLLLAGSVAWLLRHEMLAAPRRGQQRFVLVLGGLVAFSAGGSQVGLAVGPLLPLLDSFQIPLIVILVGGGSGLLFGSWTGAPRMIKALSQDYSSLSPQRSIAALVPSFAIAQTAVFLGIPVSFNEIVVSAIVGSGYAADTSEVARSKMVKTVLAWLASLLISLGFGYGVFTGIQLVL